MIGRYPDTRVTVFAAAWLLALLAGCPVLATPVAAAPTPADTIYVGPHILTLDERRPRAEAVAVAGERILAVGDAATLAVLRGPATRVVELGERALLPGFIDAHSHLSAEARFVDTVSLAPPPVGPVSSIPDLQAVLRAYIEARMPPPGTWVVGFGYDDSLLEEHRHPNRLELDAVTTDHPVFIIHVSGHLAVANSAALVCAGIDDATPDPPGGAIRRLPDTRRPDGVLEESAVFAIYGKLPVAGGQQAIERLKAAQARFARQGITTVQDGASLPGDLAALRAAAAQDALFLDVVAYRLWNPAAAPFPEDAGYGRYDGRLKLGGVKLILDGSPQGKTAYLSAPYAVPPAGREADYRGYPAMPQEAVDRAVLEALSRKVQLLAHANGDAAGEMLIDAVERAQRELPASDHRTVMIHAQTVRDDQLDRMATLGIVPSFFSAHVFFWGDWHRESVLGPPRAERISPTRSGLDRRIPFTLHNDAPVVPPDIIRLLWATVNRRTRSGDILGPGQRISAEDALRAVTLDAARQCFEEDSKGSLSPGKLADLVILSADPSTMAPERLLDLRIVETISHGRTVYADEGGR